jgi:hypothetical protein
VNVYETICPGIFPEGESQSAGRQDTQSANTSGIRLAAIRASSPSWPFPSQPPQVFLRLPHIAPDLFFQSFDRWKLDLIAQTIQKMQFDFRFRRERNRVEIQQVSFNGKRIGAERGPVSDVRD